MHMHGSQSWDPHDLTLKAVQNDQIPCLLVGALRAHKGQQLAVAADGARQAAAAHGARAVAEAAQDGVAAGVDALKGARHEIQRPTHRLRRRPHQALPQPLHKACSRTWYSDTYQLKSSHMGRRVSYAYQALALPYMMPQTTLGWQ